jgi:hypothetical protein
MPCNRGKAHLCLLLTAVSQHLVKASLELSGVSRGLVQLLQHNHTRQGAGRRGDKAVLSNSHASQSMPHSAARQHARQHNSICKL